jgi:hypothetical protein
MIRVRMACTASNISVSPDQESSGTPYWASAFGVLPPLWSSAARKPRPVRIFSNCAEVIGAGWAA